MTEPPFTDRLRRRVEELGEQRGWSPAFLSSVLEDLPDLDLWKQIAEVAGLNFAELVGAAEKQVEKEKAR